MRSIRGARASQNSLFLLVSFASLLTFVIAACGGTGSGTGSTPTPTSTTGQGYGTAHGCPSDAVVTPAPPVANYDCGEMISSL